MGNCEARHSREHSIFFNFSRNYTIWFSPPSAPSLQISAQRRGCRKTSGFLSRETGISGNSVGRIKGAKGPFDLQFLTWDFS